MNHHQTATLNSFATECFRNVADTDYIAARSCYRIGLLLQFQWFASQAIEKYLKSILLYNAISTKNLSHNLHKALDRVNNDDMPFNIKLSETQRSFIFHLHRNAQARYIEQETYSIGNELSLLDETTWSIRRYCQPINYNIKLPDGEIKNLLRCNIQKIESQSFSGNSNSFSLYQGFLEKIVSNPAAWQQEMKEALIWKNAHYSYGNTTVNIPYKAFSHTPPHVRNPSVIDFLSEYVHFPKNMQPKQNIKS